MLVKIFTDKLGDTYQIKLKNKVDFFLINNKGIEIGHMLLNETPIDGFYAIKDVYIIKEMRKKGLWKKMIYYVLEYIKSYLKAKGLVSYGYLRRPASDKAWKSIEKFADIKISKRKKDYYLTDMKLESNEYEILSYEEFLTS